jgi:predicted nucleic acid-binding protein
MTYLVETSILGRLANVASLQYPLAARATLKLHRHGHSLRTAPQNLVEFRNFATRPIAANGLGLSPSVAEGQAAQFEADFPTIPETPDIFPAWKAIVQSLGIIGKQVHDARLVAVCHVHRITHLLTFNVRHFSRMASFGPGITVVDPASV